MSRPEARTAWSALWKRRQSPSSLRIATEVSHPTPKRLCSRARHPGWVLARPTSWVPNGWSWLSKASTMSRPVCIVWRRDPALRKTALEEQVHHQLAVGVVGLGPALGASQGAELGGIGEVSGEAPALDLLNHEAPAGGPLEREVGIAVRLEPLQPFPDRLSGSGVDLASLHLAGAKVNCPERDLTPVQVQPDYDFHVGPPRAPSLTPRA